MNEESAYLSEPIGYSFDKTIKGQKKKDRDKKEQQQPNHK